MSTPLEEIRLRREQAQSLANVGRGIENEMRLKSEATARDLGEGRGVRLSTEGTVIFSNVSLSAEQFSRLMRWGLDMGIEPAPKEETP